MSRIRIEWTCAAALAAVCASTAQAAEPPLLDMAEIRAPFMAACEGQPDDTPLPVDPRTLVVPGVNTPGAAVQFNAWWVDLHDPPAPFVSTLEPNPATCGEFRASAERGRQNMMRRAYFQPFSTARNYYYIYREWGYAYRPADFDAQVIKRYGMTEAPFRNPYPYPWENPNWTDGGSGQLPLGLVQERDGNGRWTGKIASTCSGCHDSRLGTPDEAGFGWGRSSGANDAGLLQSDIFRANNLHILQLAPIPWSVGRGATDAIGIVDLLPALFDMDTLMLAPSLLEFFPDHAGGMSKAPNWYYRAFKTRQFWDGALTSDNVRSEMAFGVANLERSAAERRALTAEFEDNDNFFLSLSPPTYPGEIDLELAREGAVLFHERDLWADGGNADIPKAAGNGSCASCHGVYSPRYAHDPAYLPDPRLKGVSGVITPTETIGTDPARVGLMADERKRRAWATSYLGYNDMSPDHEGYADDIISSALRRVPRRAYDVGDTDVPFSPVGPNEWIEPFGYFATPLYGVWAGAPYFHNSSVPDLWGVLDPDDRPAVWKRQYSAPNAWGFNAGYDPSYDAYDFERLGWRYTEVECSDRPWADPFVPCTHAMATIDVLFANIANLAAAYNSLAYQSPPPITQKQIRSRMIFNSHLYSLGNEGHAFTKTLSDDERWAIIEYLKTL